MELTCYFFFPSFCISLISSLVGKEKVRYPLIWVTCVNEWLSAAHTCWTQWSRPTPRLRRGRGSRAWKLSSSPHPSILNSISSGLLCMLHIHPQRIHTSMQNRMTCGLLQYYIAHCSINVFFWSMLWPGVFFFPFNLYLTLFLQIFFFRLFLVSVNVFIFLIT